MTSPGFESVGLGTLAPVLDGSVSVAQLGSAAVGAGLGLVDDLLWADTTRRGWLALTVTASSVKADYLFVDTVKAQTYAASVGRSVTVQAAGTVAMS